jgi:tetratricopeptide (TPR) repeat protein
LDNFERTWRRAKKWAMVAMKPGKLPATADSLKYIKAVSFFEKKGQLEIAKESYLAAAAHWPNELVALMALANIYYQLGSLSEAEKIYENAIGLQQKYAPAHNNLAVVLLKQGKLLKAREHASQAVRLGGSHVKNYQDTLSDINRLLYPSRH